jgi:hypothetical protein
LNHHTFNSSITIFAAMMKSSAHFKKFVLLLFVGLILCSGTPQLFSQEQSIAREWNEMLLFSIEKDLARPTVHARNLYHTSVAMYDAWAAYSELDETVFLGDTIAGFAFPFDGVPIPDDIEAARAEAISYACYRLLTYRFDFSIGSRTILDSLDNLFLRLGYDENFTSTDYQQDGPAALGNYIADRIIEFGLQDGSNEYLDYENLYYAPVNEPLAPIIPGNDDISDPNRWQPLSLEVFIDQAGNIIPFNTPPFLGPEWGNVVPFALSEEDLNIYNRDGHDYWVYHDPGPPPFIGDTFDIASNEYYKWGFCMVSAWSSHLDTTNEVMWDISPASRGNIDFYPSEYSDYPDFYDFNNGGDSGTGYEMNPVTGEPYEPNMVSRSDYARILAEFWADGPNSETPPGHWFTILNYVNDHPLLVKKFEGQGEILNDLEWDVKSYLILGGAVHDAAVTAWGIKGYYDYIRPISAIRYMASKGQSSYPDSINYHPDGITLIDGYIELVTAEDTLEGFFPADINKIKVNAWRGPDYIEDPEVDAAGAGWILADNWWPYQRPTFVTPNFAGYISGHSTFSRAAAEVLTRMTGDPFFPGGMGTFLAKKNEFLVFEEGPSEDIELQYATYRDASDQTSLSRIWGGIHPPADDLPGRLIGIEVGNDAYDKARSYFKSNTTSTTEIVKVNLDIYPNPVAKDEMAIMTIPETSSEAIVSVHSITGHLIYRRKIENPNQGQKITIRFNDTPIGTYIVRYITPVMSAASKIIVVD